ncbi:MAG: FAD-dependent oxidoreductase [Planctomycetota bacterium]
MLPVIYDVNVAVIGGGAAAVAAASDAAAAGAKVFLMAEEPYLGEDICATYRYWETRPGNIHPLYSKLFPGESIPTPFQVKKLLDTELIEKNIPFLLCSYLSNVLFDSDDNIAAIAIANRTGEQIVRANVIIDATPYGSVLRKAGVRLLPRSGVSRLVEFTTVGGIAMPKIKHQVQQRTLPFAKATCAISSYKLDIPLEDTSYPALAAAEQVVRDQTWNQDIIDSSDRIFVMPREMFAGCASHKNDGVDPGVVDLGCFQPRGRKGIYALNGCGDVPVQALGALLNPACMMAIGGRIGKAAATEAKGLPIRKIAKGSAEKLQIEAGEARIEGSYLRPQHKLEIVRVSSEIIEIIGRYDVVVVGGGTAGAPAAISSAGNGAKTLLIEQMHGLGGTGTLGGIATYYHGYRGGFTRTIDTGVSLMGGKKADAGMGKKGGWNAQWKMEWFRQTARRAGVDIWFGATVCGAVVDGKDVKGIVVATTTGKGIVLAKRVIDATGSSDVAIAAGAAYTYTNGDHVAIQGAGLSALIPGQHYVNTDWAFISEFDVFDATRAYTIAKHKYKSAYDIGKLLQTRERRRIVGDFEITALDIINKRTYSDTISYHRSDFDSHGFAVDPYFQLQPPHRGSLSAAVPLRALLPRRIENIVVTGLGFSAQRDAMPLLRMQPCLQSQGYAVGLLSALSAADNKSYREIDLKPVQKQLLGMGNLPTDLVFKESVPVSEAAVRNAIGKLDMDLKDLHVILWDRSVSFPVLKQQLAASVGTDQKLAIAFILGMHGDGDGWRELVESVKKHSKWDVGWDYRGMGQYGRSTSPLDDLIIAAGRTGRKEALPYIHKLAEKLEANSHFSHFRAVAVAAETIKDRSSAPVLASLLRKPQVAGHAACNIKEALEKSKPGITDNSTRNAALKEIVLARALYRCGDHGELGEQLLKLYANDLCGHYARHAAAVLAKG